MSQTQTPEKSIPQTISHKTNNKPNRKTPTVITVSSSTLFLSLVSLTLLSFSFFFLSFKDTTFWFLLSNAIILLIAAVDCNTFLPSKPKPDLYDEYMKGVKSRNTHPHTYCTAEAVDTGSRRARGHDDVKENVTPPKTETVSEKKEFAETDSVLEKRELVCCSVTEKPIRDKYKRSETTKAIVVVGGKKKKDLRRSETDIGRRELGEGDLSAMSDEELNKRVEEFISRVNRQIRLQEIGDVTSL
ncbi:hypothetical protein MRB53_020518 [Persea americana]|uniref:Uncharacterized protein n=1 Tax=Persea americana TaxID=3435 RepID=A0ACC2L1E6_PERAE|nr:hypothetical protein MRB53_020518 [Persea americana]